MLSVWVVLFLAVALVVVRWQTTLPARHFDADMIIDGLMLGSAEAAFDIVGLKERHIDSVLSIGSKFNDSMYTRDVIAHHLVVRAHDAPSQNLLRHFNATNRWLAERLASKSTVLVHCRLGMSRSASLVAAFLIATRDLSLDDALVVLRSKRPIVAPNRGFLEQLAVFEEHHARQWWPQSDRLRELERELKR
jgi:predicted protein tyrosine phosphatase